MQDRILTVRGETLSSRQFDDARERERDEHVAREVGVSVDALVDHPYDLDEAGGGIAWRVIWQEGPPEGVVASGSAGSEWTEIHPLHEPDEPDE